MRGGREKDLLYLFSKYKKEIGKIKTIAGIFAPIYITMVTSALISINYANSADVLISEKAREESAYKFQIYHGSTWHDGINESPHSLAAKLNNFCPNPNQF